LLSILLTLAVIAGLAYAGYKYLWPVLQKRFAQAPAETQPDQEGQ